MNLGIIQVRKNNKVRITVLFYIDVEFLKAHFNSVNSYRKWYYYRKDIFCNF